MSWHPVQQGVEATGSLTVHLTDDEGLPRPTQHGNRVIASVEEGDPDAVTLVTDNCGGTWLRVRNADFWTELADALAVELTDGWVRGGLDGGVTAVTFTLRGSPAIQVRVGELAGRA